MEIDVSFSDEASGEAGRDRPSNAIDDLLGKIRKWYFFPDDAPLKMALATVIVAKWQGDPLWVFIIGPPSDMKTEILRSLGKDNEFVYMATDATPKSLLSGLSKNKDGKEGIDLLPKLNGRTFVLRDFTTILSKRWEEISEFFGRLRAYYDGEYSDNWGSIETKTGKSHFNLLAAVTPAIDAYSSVQQKLGERFLKIRVDTDEEKSAEYAAKSVGQEDDIRAEVEGAVLSFLKSLPQVGVDAIGMSDEAQEKIKRMARALAYLRCEVQRNRDKNILDLPQPEKPARLVKQLIKLAKGLAIVNGHDSVTDEELEMLGRVVWDTTPHVRKRVLMESCGPGKTFGELVELTELPKATLSFLLEDLVLIGLVREEGGKFMLNKKGEELLTGSGLWDYA